MKARFNFAPITVTLMQLTMGGIVKRSGPPEPVEGLAMVLPRGRETIAKACGLDDATRQASEECYPILNQAQMNADGRR